MRKKEEILKEIEEGMSSAEPYFKIESLLMELHQLGKDEVLNKIETKIKTDYDKRDHGYEYWFTGNYDDTFEMGVKTGIRDALYMIGTEVGIELEEPEQTEF